MLMIIRGERERLREVHFVQDQKLVSCYFMMWLWRLLWVEQFIGSSSEEHSQTYYRNIALTQWWAPPASHQWIERLQNLNCFRLSDLGLVHRKSVSLRQGNKECVSTLYRVVCLVFGVTTYLHVQSVYKESFKFKNIVKIISLVWGRDQR